MHFVTSVCVNLTSHLMTDSNKLTDLMRFRSVFLQPCILRLVPVLLQSKFLVPLLYANMHWNFNVVESGRSSDNDFFHHAL